MNIRADGVRGFGGDSRRPGEGLLFLGGLSASRRLLSLSCFWGSCRMCCESAESVECMQAKVVQLQHYKSRALDRHSYGSFSRAVNRSHVIVLGLAADRRKRQGIQVLVLYN